MLYTYVKGLHFGSCPCIGIVHISVYHFTFEYLQILMRLHWLGTQNLHFCSLNNIIEAVIDICVKAE